MVNWWFGARWFGIPKGSYERDCLFFASSRYPSWNQHTKETIVFQPSMFRGELLVSGRVSQSQNFWGKNYTWKTAVAVLNFPSTWNPENAGIFSCLQKWYFQCSPMFSRYRRSKKLILTNPSGFLIPGSSWLKGWPPRRLGIPTHPKRLLVEKLVSEKKRTNWKSTVSGSWNKTKKREFYSGFLPNG